MMENHIEEMKMSSNRNAIGKLWDSLTTPHSSITKRDERRQARVLIILNIIVVLQGIMTIPASSGEPVGTAIGIIGTLIILAAYFISRSRHYRLSAALLPAFFIIGGTLGTYLADGVDTRSSSIFLGLFVSFLVFLKPTPVYVTAAGTMLGMVFLIITGADTTAAGGVIPLLLIGLIASSITVVSRRHLDLIEQDRQLELREANKALRESERSLEQRVEERTRELDAANISLERALTKAIEADNIKSQFLASMSHELRTPLNAILSFSKYMRQGTFGDVNDQQGDYLGKIVGSGEHLLSLINDVLDVTKIQSGMLKLFIEDDFDIKAELATVAATAEKMLDDKPVQLVTDFDASLGTMTCDKRRVRQILYNVISNAVKFTEKGTITLSAKLRGDEVLFVVADTGPGIPREDLDVIFEPFIQTEEGVQHAHGTGLGLPISRELAQAHGGRMWVESEAGQGSSFFVQLPLETKVEDNLQVEVSV